MQKLSNLRYYRRYINNLTNFFTSKKVHMLNREGYYQILICPNCFQEKFIYDDTKNEYVCSNCNLKLNRNDFQTFAQIEFHKGILFDFNFGDKKLHKVFDHHGIFNHDITKTATSVVLNFIEDISKLNENTRGITLIKKIKKELEEYTYKSYALYVTHADIDSLLSVFSFRNPNFALKNKNILNKLSLYQDLTLFDEDNQIEFLYCIIMGLRTVFKEEGKDEISIFNYFLANLRNILTNPNLYKKYALIEKEHFNKNYNKLLNLKNQEDYIFVDKHLGKPITQFIVPNGFNNLPALFKFLQLYKNGRYNLPLLIKYNVKKVFCSFSVNPNVKGYEIFNLSKLEPIILNAEKNKLDQNKKNEVLKVNLTKMLEDINQEIQQRNSTNHYNYLRMAIQNKELDRFESILLELEKHDNSQEIINIRDLFNKIIYLTKTSDSSVTNTQKKIKQFKGKIIKLITSIINTQSNQDLIYEQDKIKTQLREIGTNKINEDIANIWVFKSSFIGVKFNTFSNLTNQEILKIIKDNIDLIYKK
ncbi:MAG: TFIIB-type zinc ribbon-containing protein [Nanoarchaeota archaeon]